MRARDAIRQAFHGVEGALTAGEVIRRVRAAPCGERWAEATLRTTLRALAPNTMASRYSPSERRHGFLFALGRGRYRRWDDATDGVLEDARSGRAARPEAPRRRPRDAADTAVDGAERRRLLEELAEAIDRDPHQPMFRREPYGDPVVGWGACLKGYFWPHPVMDLRATHEVLTPWFNEAGDLAQRLSADGGWTDDERRRAAILAWQMLTWGGVTRQRAFSPSVVEAVFRKALGLPGGESAPMNSGWTKVAALATAFLEGDGERAPHVIWDSRVTTAIVSRLDRILRHDQGHIPARAFPRVGVVPGRGGTRPRRLAHTWAHAYGSWPSQEAGSALVRELRDLLNQGRYGWMPLPHGGERLWTIRGVESVLFMDGY